MSDLPEGWVDTILSEVAETKLGKMLSKKSKTGVGSRPYLRNKNVQWWRFDLSDVGEMDFSDTEFSKFALRDGDLLVCEGGEVGRCAIWRGQIPGCCYQKAVHRVRPHRGVLAEYLQYVMRFLADSNALEKHVTGSTIKHLPQEDLRILSMPLPPTTEQTRIVAAIEEQFSRLDAAEEGLRHGLLNVYRFRASARALATRVDSPIVKLSEVTAAQGYGSSAKATQDSSQGVPMLRMGNIVDGRFTFDDLKYLPDDHPDVAKYELQEGDLLFNRTNSPELVGKTAVFKGRRRALFASYLIRIRLLPECEPDWASLVINGPLGRSYIAEVRTQQVGQANVNGTKLAALPVPLPPIEEQRRIVAEVERQLSIADAMQAAIDSALAKSARLRRSILDRAFRGTLVPQDPTDEPASVLLDRIRAERVVEPKKRRTRAKA
ncbi:MAG: restriction endonuclease subunit S [Acidimicrobiia bacterium]